ncbi:lysophospholipid acyltransferase family protein [bacterium]|nr:lysophospholipid acyltransferase family protein [bacterium]RQV97444.1 MAG: DUF374 domain-containing protein [bacterium]
MYLHILSTLAWLSIHSLYATLQIKSIGYEKLNHYKKNGQKVIYAFWHGRQFLLVRYMSNKNISIMSSTSRDGILQANILKKFKYEIISGSSAKSPVRALIGSIQKMRAGYDVGFAVDGPRGPLHKVKPGAIFLAKKMHVPIIPLSFSAKPAIILNSWDHYMLPKPFSKSAIVFGEPFHPSQNFKSDTINSECSNLENILNHITQQADKMVKFES